MTGIYAMQRANGDWFALDDHGRFCVPLFHNSRDAMMARLRNFGMLLFKPVELDARLLEQLVPVSGGSDTDFCMVNDPFVSLNRSQSVAPAELALLMRNPEKSQHGPANVSRIDIPRLRPSPQRESGTEVWEDEGGRYSRCA